jgi:transcriptional regulator with XRE-family HTH domain
LRAVEAATGISAATLSRVERGSTPESAIIQRLAEWLEVSVVHADTGGPVLATTAIRTDEDLKRTIAVHLRANKKLAPEVASAIADGFEYFMRAEIARAREHQRVQQRSTPHPGRGTPNAGGSEGL